MIKLLTSKLLNSSVHFIGNRNNDERVIFTKKPLNIENQELNHVLCKFFTNQFNAKEELFRFTHSSDLNLNEIYSFISDIFDNPNSFHFNTVKIGKFLYEKTIHPKVKSGELYFGYLKDCIIEGDVVDAICIFKCENKTTFLSVNQIGEELVVSCNSSGVNIEKTDKACIIFNVNRENGYKVCMTDNTNKLGDTQYWKDSFLNVENISNSYSQTDAMIGLYRNFIQEQFSNKDNITEKIALINRSVDYFKKEEHFNINDFSEKVLIDSNLRGVFEDYKTLKERENNIQITDEFSISNVAFKKQSRKLKSVLKLDNNFHIYIHGNQDMIEQGIDEKTGKKFYKIYYETEK